ncbi:MAG TPA: SCO family protein [Thermoanaerobaculia bacterium]|nr:SCO family protein [Thermoanaerobaculia bacterium]
MTLLFLVLTACQRHSDLPKLFPVPNVPLVNETGQSVTLGQNKGFVTVYDFIYTNCAGTCPMMTQAMRKLTPKVPKDAAVKFVSISIDPTRDTPHVLRDYATAYRNDPRWTFLTGERRTIVDLSVNGFKLAAGDPGPGSDPLLHSSKFVVADKSGTIREYYGGTDGDAPDHVAKTVKDLLRED